MGLFVGIVVVIHGFFQPLPAPTSPALQAVLEDAGYRVYYPGTISNDPREAGPQIAALVDQARADNGVDKVHLIGISMGGVSALQYAKSLNGNSKLLTVTTLDSPLYGLWNCLPYWPAMCPLSPFFNGLHYGDDTPGSTFYKQIIATPVVDPLKAILLDGGVCPKYVPTTHREIVDDPEIHKAILAGLTGIC